MTRGKSPSAVEDLGVVSTLADSWNVHGES